jgi:hypothetical protein
MKSYYLIILTVLMLIGSIGNAQEKSVIDNSSTVISFDIIKGKKLIKNIFSDINVWDFRGYWGQAAVNQPADYFSINYPFVKNVQFMTATGGNPSRDLFLNPSDNNILDDYKFDELISALHNVVKQGLKPMLKTGAVPLKYSVDPTIGFFGVNVKPPYNYDIYYNYIKALAGKIVSEFGIDEVKTWSWGVLTEYENKDWFNVDENNPELSKIAFFKLYDYTVAALEDAIGADNLIVGAHSMTCNPGLWDEQEFIDHVAKGTNYRTGKSGTQIDFLSASYYDLQPGIPVAENLDLANTINLLRNRAIANGLTNLKYGIDEGRILSGPEDKTRSLGSRIVAHSFQGAADARLFKEMNNLDADWISTWALSTEGFWGGVHSVGTHIANLSYKMVGERQISQTVNGVLNDSTNEVNGIGSYNSKDNKVHVLVYNYNNSLSTSTNETLTISINNIQLVDSSVVIIKRWIIDDEHANFWPTWFADMNSRGLTNDDFNWASRYSLEAPLFLINKADKEYWYSRESVYKTIAKLQPEISYLTIENNKITLTAELAPHGVIFYELEKVCPIQ